MYDYNILNRTVLSVVFVALSIIALFSLKAIESRVEEGNAIQADIRSIVSEERDAVNVQNCYMMNHDLGSFNSCLND